MNYRLKAIKGNNTKCLKIFDCSKGSQKRKNQRTKIDGISIIDDKIKYPLIVSTAVTIDIAILCTYFLIGDKLEYGLTKMVEYCENKFNIPIGLVAVSRVSFEVPYDEHEKIFFEYFNKEFLEKYYPHIGNLPMIDVTSIDKAEEAINGLLSTLQDNIEVI